MAVRLSERTKRFFEDRELQRDNLHQDDFSGAEIDREVSLLHGVERNPIARLRLRALKHAAGMSTVGEVTGPMAGDTIPGTSNWVQMGPMAIPNGQTYTSARVIVSGRISAIAVHPTLPNTIYVGSARGGVWKTTDGGLSWNPISDHQASLAIGTIAIAPSAPETVYAGTGEGNIYYLTAFHPLNALNESYQGSGLLKSTTGGASWNLQGEAEFTGKAFYRIAVHPTNPDLVYAATSGGLYRTDDGGMTWAALSGGLPTINSTVIAATDVVFDPVTPDNVYCAYWGAGIYVTTTGGTVGTLPTWTPASGGPGSSADRISLAVSPTSPTTVYALAATSTGGYLGFYRNTGGTAGTFTLVMPASGTVPAVSTSMLFVIVDVTTPDTVYLCGTGLHKATRNTTTDSWTFTNIGGPIHPDVRTLALHPTKNQILFAGTDGGIYQSGDGGGTWSDSINKRLCITQFEFADHHPTQPAVVFSGTQDNGIEQYRGSEVFYHADDGDGGQVAIDRNAPVNVLAEHYSISPERSTLAGKFGSFNAISAGLVGSSLFYPPFALDATNPNNIAFGTDRLCLDMNQGTGGWPTKVTLPGATGRVSAVTYVNSNLIYAATSSGEVYRAVLSGTWTATPIHASPLPTRWIWHIVVSPIDSNTITVALGGFGGGHVFRGVVNEAGTAATWTDRSGGSATALPDAPANSLVIDPAHTSTLYVGTDVGVYVSTDDGVSWSDFRQGLPNTAIYDLKLHEPSRLLRAATHGRGMWEREIDEAALNDTTIYVRDNVMHTGRGTAPFNQPAAFEDQLHHVLLGDPVFWWQCADIKTDSDAGGYQMPVSNVDFVAFESELINQDPIRNHVNHVFAQVHNRGIAPGDVTVKLFYADASGGLPPLQSDFWNVFPGDPSAGDWKPIGAAQTMTVKPGEPTVFEWDWTPPSTAAQHSCLLVVCDSSADPIPSASKVLDVAMLVNSERRVGLKNMHVIDPIDDVLVLPFTVHPRGPADQFRIFASRHLAGWQVGLLLPLPVIEHAPAEVARVAVPAEAFGRIVLHARRHAHLFEHGKMLHVSHESDPAFFAGLHHDASFPAFLILVRPARAKRGSITIVHEHDGKVLGGNTFVIVAPLEKAADPWGNSR